jgi:glycosyltransferase involved in cell wall biosynthesis
MSGVLLVSEPGVDGVFRHVEALGHFLMNHGHRVHLAYSDVRGSDRLSQLVADVEKAGGCTLNLKVGNSPGPSDFGALIRLRSLVKKAKPEVIHGHSSKAGALVRGLAFLGIDQPKFYTPHAYYGLAGGAGLKAKCFNMIERVLGRIGTSIVLSAGEQSFAENTLHVPRQNLKLIPNPVDTTRFVPANAEARSAMRSELGVPEGARLLGSVGRLAFQKDPLTLYRAFAEAIKLVPDLWLYHLGEGELTSECEALASELGIADRIIRRIYLSEPVSFYQVIDGMILTSRYEGLSFAVLEALACDLPVILTEVPGNLDFMAMGLSHAWSAPKEDPSQIAGAIRLWAEDLSAKRPRNHREAAQSRFSQEACFGAIVSAYGLDGNRSS